MFKHFKVFLWVGFVEANSLSLRFLLNLFVLKLCEVASVLENLDKAIFIECLARCFLYLPDSLDSLF